MKTPFPIIFFLFLAFSQIHAQTSALYCAGNRFSGDSVIRTEDIRVRKDIIFDTARDWQGVLDTLKLDIYHYKNDSDTLAKRPTVLMLYGGGFVGGDKDDVKAICDQFAKRGYVAVAINYRLGWSCGTGDTLSRVKAVYRAMQDAHTALRFLADRAAQYKIDTAWVFGAGQSAGAGTILNMNYISQAEIDNAYPSLSPALGLLNKAGNPVSFKGIFNNWGGVDTQFFDLAETKPTISFHGTADPVVPIGTAPDETNCLADTPWVYGSGALHLKIKSQYCSRLYMTGGGHGIYQDADGKRYRVSRAADFFKSIFCGNCTDGCFFNKQPNCDTSLLRTRAAQEPQWSLIPNPAGNVLYIGGITPAADLKAVVYDLSGRLLLSAAGTDRIDVSTLAAGVYFVVVGNDHKYSRMKFIKL